MISRLDEQFSRDNSAMAGSRMTVRKNLSVLNMNILYIALSLKHGNPEISNMELLSQNIQISRLMSALKNFAKSVFARVFAKFINISRNNFYQRNEVV